MKIAGIVLWLSCGLVAVLHILQHRVVPWLPQKWSPKSIFWILVRLLSGLGLVLFGPAALAVALILSDLTEQVAKKER